MSANSLLIRRVLALLVFIASLWLWTLHSDVIALIIRQRPVLFGRYSQGHLGALLVLTPILWALAAALASRRPLRQALGNTVLGIGSTLAAILLITYLAHFLNKGPRYLETKLATEQAQAMELAGAVRHRPPNQVFELTYHDRPEQARSYPDAPAGYPDIPLTLTTDANGFRNPPLAAGATAPRYDILAVGDSFVAGSNVSDDQAWPALLARATGESVYNLGVGGAMRAGFRYARRFGYARAIQVDADGQHDPRDIPRVLAGLEPTARHRPGAVRAPD